jgi:hypothetical protein
MKSPTCTSVTNGPTAMIVPSLNGSLLFTTMISDSVLTLGRTTTRSRNGLNIFSPSVFAFWGWGCRVGHYVVHGQFDHFHRLLGVFSTPIALVLVQHFWITAATAHDLGIFEIQTS